MRLHLRKQVDLLTKIKNFIKFSYEHFKGEKSYFRSLVSLSPAIRITPPNLIYCEQDAISKIKRASITLCVDETIEESNYVQGLRPLVIPTQVKHSDTILNSTSSYPIKSNITTHNWRFYDK